MTSVWKLVSIKHNIKLFKIASLHLYNTILGNKVRIVRCKLFDFVKDEMENVHHDDNKNTFN